jgi:hypothetical protein
MEPTSDNQLQFIGEVEFLQVQVKTTGNPVNQNFGQRFLQIVDSKSLPERIKKWQIRKDRLQRLSENLRVTATSGGPAGLPAVGEAQPSDDTERKRKREANASPRLLEMSRVENVPSMPIL